MLCERQTHPNQHSERLCNFSFAKNNCQEIFPSSFPTLFSIVSIFAAHTQKTLCTCLCVCRSECRTVGHENKPANFLSLPFRFLVWVPPGEGGLETETKNRIFPQFGEPFTHAHARHTALRALFLSSAAWCEFWALSLALALLVHTHTIFYRYFRGCVKGQQFCGTWQFTSRSGRSDNGDTRLEVAGMWFPGPRRCGNDSNFVPFEVRTLFEEIG